MNCATVTCSQVLGIDPAKIDWSSPLWAIANKRFESQVDESFEVFCIDFHCSAFMDNSKAKRVLGFTPRYNNAAECAHFLLPMLPL